MKRTLKESSNPIDPRVIEHIKKYFPGAPEQMVTDFVSYAKDFVEKLDKQFYEEYSDFFDEEYYIDTTRSTDWSPSERIANNEEMRDIIEDDHGTEEDYVERCWENTYLFDDIFKNQPISQYIMDGDDFELAQDLYELYVECLPLEKVYTYRSTH